MTPINKNKYFCDQCSKSRFGDVTFSSFDKHRDFTNHLSIEKHLRNCSKLRVDPSAVHCKYCDKFFSKEGYDVHKKRNERLWSIKNVLKNDYLTCNRFKWEFGGKLFASMEELIQHRNNPVVSCASAKKLSLTECGLVNNFSYLKSNENKSMEEKEIQVEKQLIEEAKYQERPDLELCMDCSNYTKKYYFNGDEEYSSKHLSMFQMEDCGCRYEED
tara:strand:+ start:55 stop:702 length:648 start_codon:yes stop_codon:yes gene_type:complete